MPKKIRKNVSLGEWIITRTEAFCAGRDRDFSSVVEEALDFYLDHKQAAIPPPQAIQRKPNRRDIDELRISKQATG